MRRFQVKPMPKTAPQVLGGEVYDLPVSKYGEHVFLVHVSDPIGMAPSTVVGTFPKGWNIPTRKVVEFINEAPGPISFAPTPVPGVIEIHMPAFCALPEAQRIVEVAMRQAFDILDGHTDSFRDVAAMAARRLIELRKALQTATEAENYEEAARLRDEIKTLQDTRETGDSK